jgi:hypothetical protein
MSVTERGNYPEADLVVWAAVAGRRSYKTATKATEATYAGSTSEFIDRAGTRRLASKQA